MRISAGGTTRLTAVPFTAVALLEVPLAAAAAAASAAAFCRKHRPSENSVSFQGIADIHLFCSLGSRRLHEQSILVAMPIQQPVPWRSDARPWPLLIYSMYP